LESAIIQTIFNSPRELTNQEVRKQVHQLGYDCSKRDVNVILHNLKKSGTLEFREQGTDKYWRLVRFEVDDEENEEYFSTLQQVKTNAWNWKNKNQTNQFPKKIEKIKKFIENSAVRGLRSDLLDRVAQDICENGWD
jgi:hypothetical protein